MLRTIFTVLPSRERPLFSFLCFPFSPHIYIAYFPKQLYYGIFPLQVCFAASSTAAALGILLIVDSYYMYQDCDDFTVLISDICSITY